MANSAGSKKRARQAEKRRKHNASLRSMVRTYLKKVLTAIEAGEKETAESAFVFAVPLMDRSVKLGIFHKNKIARQKSRMHAKIQAL